MTTSAGEPDFWMASVEAGSSQVNAFGRDPEGAVQALVESWAAACEAWGRGDPAYLSDLREEIIVVGCNLGQGYVLGVTDGRWYQDRLSGRDVRFDNLFSSTSPAP